MTSFAELMALRKRKARKPSSFKALMRSKRQGDEHASMKVAKSAVIDDQRLVYGWASVITKDGADVFDTEGDRISGEVLEQAAHDYLQRSRVGKRQHRGRPTMDLVESVVLTREKQQAMGIDLPMEGWWVGFRVNDPAVWAEVRNGDLPALSIHGSALRLPVP